MDSSTGLPLQFANVFVNNTTINTVTDEEGKYILSGISPGTFELVVSYVGYITLNRRIELQTANNPIVDFSLEPKEDDLEEIDVTSRMDKKWGKQLKRFEKVFIGNPQDSIAGTAKILNPWVLDFGEGKTSGGPRYFYATAQEPIQIENSALGYRIMYDLLDFKQTRNGFNYLGLSRFVEMEPSTGEIAELWHENRQRVFFGSTRHLLKTMIERDTTSKEYQVYEVNPFPSKHERTNVFFRELGNSLELVPIDSIAISTRIPGRNLLVSDAMLEAHHIKGFALNNFYRDVKFPISWLTFKNDTLVVDPNGVPLDPAQLILSGQMAEDRMGRFLPLDFKPDLELAYLQEEANILEDPNKWNSLREKPFVQTDKSYYYPGETIWFKSNMMYQNPIMADSLSQVLYVEIFSDQELTATGTFPITKGSSNGQLKLPNNLPKGNYVLRAYTNWMRNFGDADFFYQAIPVLDLNEKVIGPLAPSREPEIDPEVEVQLIPENVQLVSGGKNSITLKLLDSYGEPAAAELSVSVLNSNLVTPISEDPNTDAALNWLLEPEMITPADSLEYPIEYGIAFSGQFLNRKDRPEKANITIVQGKYDDYGVVETDSLGRFYANGLYFTDSAEIAIAAFDDKLRRYGRVLLDEKSIPTLSEFFPKMDLQIEITPTNQRDYILEEMAGVITMEEVIVEDEKIEQLRERNYGYGEGDYSYTEKDLEKYLHLTLGEFLQRFALQSNRNWGLKTGGKLFIIDGVRIEPGSDTGNLPPLSEVAKISIFTNSNGIFGMAGFAGATMITTKSGGRFVDDPEKKIFDKSLFQLFTMGGFTKEQKFPDFENSTQNRSLIDYQPTVYWNPSIQTNPESGEASFSFYSGDTETTYRIVIQGLTDENIPFRMVKNIRVGK